ncbi:MAG: hypothetical protein K2X81_05035, partial [Candidatus Obscuribacterales bacterium]|nr:hypothetical protein [Candidatus Obscuribacterales bacterium]
GGMGGIFRYWAFDWLWDWWYWGDYLRPSPYYYPEIPTQTTQLPESKGKKDSESFLDKCFSYLFGDGDPNAGLEERYWQTIGQVLKANNGVVIAEQLAPYANVNAKNEDWMLPILVRFNGNCEVSENGNIIYIFPSFHQDLKQLKQEPAKASGITDAALAEELHQLFNKNVKHRTAAQNRQIASSHLEPYLKERLWEFSHITDGTKTTIIALAIFLIVGGIWLTTMVVAMPLLLPLTPVLLGMSAYGAMFLLVPWIRSMIIAGLNSKIEERNAVRYSAANRLRDKDSIISKKLIESSAVRDKIMDEASSESIAFSTDKDSLEQQFDDKSGS